MANLSPSPKIQFFDANGNPLAGGKLYTYAAGTTTPLATYTDAGGGTPNANPVIMDSRGEANVWLGSATYKFKLTTSTDVELWTVDNISSDLYDTLTDLAASGGSALVGFLQSGTGAVARTVQSKLRDVVSVEDFGAVGDGVADDTSAIQKAINAAYKVTFPAGTYKVTSTITLQPSSFLVGDGASVSVINSTASGFTFELLNSNGTAEVESPKFCDLGITTTNSGIRLNSQSGGFTNDNTSQKYMMRGSIQRCVITGGTTGTGIQWSKCFDGVIRECKITGFAYGVDFLGNDICTIEDNRIRSAATNLIRVRSSGTFGSQTKIAHNDLLALSAGTGSVIETSDRDFIFKDNYVEQSAAIASVINITGGLAATIDNNRIEAPASGATNWLVVSSKLQKLYVVGNKNTGNAWGAALFDSGSGANYYYNNTYRQKIIHFGNATETGFPFNTVEDQAVILPRQKTVWVFTPSVTGLVTSDYGQSCKVINNEFVLPPLASFGSLLQFYDSNFPVTGSVNIYFQAYASVGSQTFKWQRLNTSTPISSGNVSLTTSLAWYTLASGVSVTDLRLKFWNDDTVTNGTAYLKQIVVEFA